MPAAGMCKFVEVKSLWQVIWWAQLTATPATVALGPPQWIQSLLPASTASRVLTHREFFQQTQCWSYSLSLAKTSFPSLPLSQHFEGPPCLLLPMHSFTSVSCNQALKHSTQFLHLSSPELKLTQRGHWGRLPEFYKDKGPRSIPRGWCLKA